MRRVEGAAAGVRRAAEDVSSTAKTISNSNSLSDIALLKTQLIELNRLVISSRLAVVVSGEESERP
jgi:tetrahydromethanopterin S-methyltransferase subunit E